MAAPAMQNNTTKNYTIMETNEQKAKAYDAVLERAKDMYAHTGNGYAKQIMEQIFPELKESEDERIRKSIYRYINVTLDDNESAEKEKWLAWLEKQKEFVSTGFKDVWERMDCEKLTAPLERYSKDAIMKLSHAWYDKGIELERKRWLEKQGEHKSNWSEDDDQNLLYVLVKLEPHITAGDFAGIQNWLKSIKDRLKQLKK